MRMREDVTDPVIAEARQRQQRVLDQRRRQIDAPAQVPPPSAPPPPSAAPAFEDPFVQYSFRSAAEGLGMGSRGTGSQFQYQGPESQSVFGTDPMLRYLEANRAANMRKAESETRARQNTQRRATMDTPDMAWQRVLQRMIGY